MPNFALVVARCDALWSAVARSGSLFVLVYQISHQVMQYYDFPKKRLFGDPGNYIF